MKFNYKILIATVVAILATKASQATDLNEDVLTIKVPKGSPETIIADALRENAVAFVNLIENACQLPETVRDQLVRDPKLASITFANVKWGVNTGWKKSEDFDDLAALGRQLRVKPKAGDSEEIEFKLEGDTATHRFFETNTPEDFVTLAMSLLACSDVVRGALLKDHNDFGQKMETWAVERDFVEQVKAGSLSVINARAQSLEVLNPAESLQWYFTELILSYGYQADIAGFIATTRALPLAAFRESLKHAAVWIQQNITRDGEIGGQIKGSVQENSNLLRKGRVSQFFEAVHSINSKKGAKGSFLKTFAYLGLSNQPVNIELAIEHLKTGPQNNAYRKRIESLFNAIFTKYYVDLAPANEVINNRQAANQALFNWMN